MGSEDENETKSVWGRISAGVLSTISVVGIGCLLLVPYRAESRTNIFLFLPAIVSHPSEATPPPGIGLPPQGNGQYPERPLCSNGPCSASTATDQTRSANPTNLESPTCPVLSMASMHGPELTMEQWGEPVMPVIPVPGRNACGARWHRPEKPATAVTVT